MGEALVRLLQEQGRPVRGLDILPSPYTEVVGSITDANLCQTAMEGVTHVIHTATLHKPHVATHTRQDFVDVNITGTLNLLEAAVAQGSVQAFIFTSTTSTFGDALKPKGPDAPAVWIDETVKPVPKNIYGVTKVAAEDLCQLFHRLYKLPCLVLKVSRFFPEDDDTEEVRNFCSSDNAKVNELLFRRADIYDMATAHLAALDKAPSLGFDRFVITGSSPFLESDRVALHQDAPTVVASYFPQMAAIYAKRGWKMFPKIDRVYRNEHARDKLGWTPVYDFAHTLECLEKGDVILGSDLSRQVGIKGYHADDAFASSEAPYPT